MHLRPTLMDIARRVGFAKATVSLALRDHPKISESTRKLVQKTARDLNYRPDPALSQIAAQRWKTGHATGAPIAFVTTLHPTGRLLDIAALECARAYASTFGYDIDHFRFEDYATAKHLGKALYARGIGGVIVGQITRPEFCEDFPWENFSCVACNSGFFKPPVDLVMPDHSHAVLKTWEKVWKAGYRRIGFALFDESPLTAVDDFDKVSAALYCQASNRCASVPILHYRPQEPERLSTWVREHKPDAVIGFNDSTFFHLKDAGYRVPIDFAFASLMLDSQTPQEHGLAGVDYDTTVLGQTAFERVSLMLKCGNRVTPARPAVVMIESLWRDGATMPPKECALSMPPREPSAVGI